MMKEENKIIFKSKHTLSKTNMKTSVTRKPNVVLNIFDDDFEDLKPNTNKEVSEKPLRTFSSSLTLKKSAKLMDKAVEEDPNVFEYDNIYDSIETSKTHRNQTSQVEDKNKPKYMKSIIESAAFRKRENDRRLERKIQKERECEDPELANTECFVTNNYRKILEERKEEDDLLRQKEEFDRKTAATMDLGMTHFYRHLILDQNMKCDDDMTLKTEKLGTDFTKTDDLNKSTEKNSSTKIYGKKKLIRNSRKVIDNQDENSGISENEASAGLQDVDCENSVVNKVVSNNNITDDELSKLEKKCDEKVSSSSSQDDNVLETDIPKLTENSKVSATKKSTTTFLGTKIYDKRNNEESILAAIKRFEERKKAEVIQHFLMASVDPDDD